MSMPKATPSPNARHFIQKHDGRDHEFHEMLRVDLTIPGITGMCMTNPDRPQPGVSADYWEVMPRVEGKLERARAEREEKGKEQYQQMIDGLMRKTPDKQPRETKTENSPAYPRAHPTGRLDWDVLDPLLKKPPGETGADI
jgi:hypothetical protein